MALFPLAGVEMLNVIHHGRTEAVISLTRCVIRRSIIHKGKVTAQVVPQKAACGRARDRKANFSSANSPTDRLSEGVPGHHRGVPGQLRKEWQAEIGGSKADTSNTVAAITVAPASRWLIRLMVTAPASSPSA